MATASPTDPQFKPYVADDQTMPELTISALILGSCLGIIFAASSLYLVLKVGMTVSASIPVAVLAITVFRAFSKTFGLRQATILENNIVQTAGSAGESIAFGVGVTMPALLILGFHMDITRVMVVSLLGGLLGILAMIPLRRAFIVKLHGRPGEPGKLLYPEGTACAQVLISGEKGGATGKTIFVGFGLAFLHKFATEGLKVIASTPQVTIGVVNRAAVLASEMASELLGVGYIIGLRTSAIMMSGAILGYLVIIPLIALIGDYAGVPIPPGKKPISEMKDPSDLRNAYLLFIGAGCVATAGILSMFRTLPMIVRSVGAGLSSMGGSESGDTGGSRRRTENDMSMTTVLVGSFALLGLLAAFLTTQVPLVAALAGALLVVVFGFLFVTVSSRLTGEIGSSSNPISGMTVATLTLTCLIFLALGWQSSIERVLALSIAAVVCVAASNGGTTAQSLKTGFLVGGTPRSMQYAILVGALTSGVVIGGTLLAFNQAGTVYSQKPDNLPGVTLTKDEVKRLVDKGAERDEYEHESYLVWDTERDIFKENEKEKFTPREEVANARKGRYLVDETSGEVRYLKDPKIMGKLQERDDGTTVKRDFPAPKTQVMGLIINGVLKQELNWSLVAIGGLIAVFLELCGVSSLAFAVGLYVPIQYSTPIFLGGIVRWAVDSYMSKRHSAAVEAATDPEARAQAEIEAIRKSETSPGVLLAAGYIAGGSLAGMLLSFAAFSDTLPKDMALWEFHKHTLATSDSYANSLEEVARVTLGIPKGKDLSDEAKEKLKALKEDLQGANKDLPTLWAPVQKGTVLKLAEYEKVDVNEDTTIGEFVDKNMGGQMVEKPVRVRYGQQIYQLGTSSEDNKLTSQILSLNRKTLKPAEGTKPADVKIPKGTKLTLPRKKTMEVKEDTTLGALAKQILGREDKASELKSSNEDVIKPADTLPANAQIKIPRAEWPALVAFAGLALLLMLVGMDKVLRVPES